MIITIYADAGHAWGKVNKALLNKLGIADKISHYSYMRGDKVYLEEDKDLGLFFYTLDMEGIKYQIEDRFSHKTSRIRGYDAYKFVPTHDQIKDALREWAKERGIE